jgi:addiction module HigA family antidote
MKNNMRPVHPGEILREEFLMPLGLSANRLAQAIGVPTNRITELVGGRRAMTADTAFRGLRHVGGVLDEPPAGLRDPHGIEESRPQPQEDQAVQEDCVIERSTTRETIVWLSDTIDYESS